MTTLSTDRSSRYLKIRKLGEGTYGKVHLLEDKDTSALVAVKIISFDPKEQKKVRSEVDILSQCNSPFIVKYKEAFIVKSTSRNRPEKMWVVTEYCSRGSVSDLLEECCEKGVAVPKACIQYISASILSGLKYLHVEMDIVHRDVKPANVLMTADCKVKLADFGVSKALYSKNKCKTMVGSIHYIAPEIMERKYYDGKADVFSTGKTVAEMASINSTNNEDDPDMQDFVLQCLLTEPTNRPDSATLLGHPFVEDQATALETSLSENGEFPDAKGNVLYEFCTELEELGHTPDARSTNSSSSAARQLERPSTPRAYSDSQFLNNLLLQDMERGRTDDGTFVPTPQQHKPEMPTASERQMEVMGAVIVQDTSTASPRHAPPKRRHHQEENDHTPQCTFGGREFDLQADNTSSPPRAHRRVSNRTCDSLSYSPFSGSIDSGNSSLLMPRLEDEPTDERTAHSVNTGPALAETASDVDASEYLVKLRETRWYRPPFQVLGHTTQTSDTNMVPVIGSRAQATIKVKTSQLSTLAYLEQEETHHEDVSELGEADGTFDAVATALKKALVPSHPYLENVKSVDYSVCILDSDIVTGAKTCTTMRFIDSFTGVTYTTRGVDQDVIGASVIALVDGLEYALVEYAVADVLHSGLVV